MDKEFSVIQEGRMLVTPAIATYILNWFNFAGQRKLVKQHVATLTEAMKCGDFLAGSQLQFGALPDGSFHLINGQHRLAAVIASSSRVEFVVTIHRCASRQELDEAYRKLDYLQKLRSPATIVGLCDFLVEADIRRPIAIGALSAIAIIANGMHVPTWGRPLPIEVKTAEGKFRHMRPFVPQIKLYDEIVRGCPTNMYPRVVAGPFMAPCLIILRDQPETGTKFVSAVSDGASLDKGDPRLTLHQTLSNKTWAKNKRGSAVTFAVCNTWNAFVRGKKVEILRDFGTEPELLGCKIGPVADSILAASRT